MSFSVLEWLISKSLDLSVTKSFGSINNLQFRLNKAVDDWAKKLPNSASLISVAMYLDIHDNDENDTCLKVICRKLESSKLPTRRMLIDALYEKWSECKANGADQSFFLIDKEAAKVHIQSLASEILSVLVQEKELFNNFVHSQLSHLRTENKEIRETLQTLQALIRKNELSIKPPKKIFRPIPDCCLPVLDDQEARKLLFLAIFKISLFKTFQDKKYHKFTCLMTYSENAFYLGDEDLPGLILYSGEIAFLSNFRNLVDLYLKNSQQFLETLDIFYNKPEFTEVNLRYELLCTKGLFAYEIEIDGHAERYTVLRKPSAREIDYDHMHSLNSALQIMPTMTLPSIFLIEFDKIGSSPAMTKFIYCCLLEDKIDLGRLRVNVDDFDDWDFEYTLKTKKD